MFPPPPCFKCTCISGVSVVHVAKLDVFTFLVPCCDVRYDFCVKTMFGSFLISFRNDVLSEGHVLLMLHMYLYFLRILV